MKNFWVGIDFVDIILGIAFLGMLAAIVSGLAVDTRVPDWANMLLLLFVGKKLPQTIGQ